MRTELEYMQIDGMTGGNQDWFSDPMMKLGGCAAVCACDSCIYFARAYGLKNIYPFDAEALNRADYIRFSKVMKPYLRPRWEGVNKPQIYIDGLQAYLLDRGERRLGMTQLSGDCKAEDAKAALIGPIDAGMPVPCLILNHRDRTFADYEWHWFMLTGYDTDMEDGMVKAVTYGGEKWLSFAKLWDTGNSQRGGLVLYQILS